MLVVVALTALGALTILPWLGRPAFSFHQDEHFVLSSADMLR